MKDTKSFETSQVNQKLICQRLNGLKFPLTPERRKSIIDKLKSTDHKMGVNPNDWDEVGEKLLVICEFFTNRCTDKGLKLLWTSIIRKRVGASTTDIHEKKRAADAHTWSWPEDDKRLMESEVNDACAHIGAIGQKSGISRAAVFEDGITAGHGEHMHLQCRW